MKPVNLISLGVVILIVGFIIVFLGMMLQSQQSQNEKHTKGSNVKVAVGGFFGPIPFGFGNDKTLMYVVMAVSVFFMLMWFILPHLR
ncbi:TPA: DUF131 domain-containing protein [Candidatus Woesearchaeota archaeon]|nr:DUF131 domain-containing protein [Candidatus Woesearchaeota archaeon]HIH47516.1 DUF131 domain-containing protein [Candidatus Woesearchaeota archaeon]HII88372.1 DUF131 domain-containing protein [Candidatus Woesearchaeota archaeon]